jgi:hypothetical protein
MRAYCIAMPVSVPRQPSRARGRQCRPADREQDVGGHLWTSTTRTCGDASRLIQDQSARMAATGAGRAAAPAARASIAPLGMAFDEGLQSQHGAVDLRPKLPDDEWSDQPQWHGQR